MKKTRLLLLSLLILCLTQGIEAQEQDTIRSLIFSEWYSNHPTDAYFELTNMGTEAVDLSRFTVAQVNVNSGSFIVDENGVFRCDGGMGGNTKLRLVDSIISPNTLAPGATLLFAACNYDPLELDTLWPEEPTFREDLIEKADFVVYNQGVPWTRLMYHNGLHAQILFYHLDDGDSIIVDVVRLHLDADGDLIKEQSAVAGVAEATGDHNLIRKFSIKQGNIDWNKSAGVTAEDSEWMLIPDIQGRMSHTTAGEHGDFGISLESSEVDIDIPNAKLTVPWGWYRGDTIVSKMTLGPGLGWHFDRSASFADSSHAVLQTGDILTMYATGNDLDRIDFEIVVTDAAPDMALVFPRFKKVYEEGAAYDWIGNPIPPGDWQQPYYVTVQQPGIDTIGEIPYATRIDTMFKYLEKAPEAAWEIVWKDGTARADLSNGDILKVTSQDGTVIKEYFIDVQEYAASDNVSLGAIMWPDKDEFLEGWKGDTIPGFSPTKTAYTVLVPYGSVNVPSLVAYPVDINAELDVQRAVSLTGSLAERTTLFTVTSQSDTMSQEYAVTFKLEKDPFDVQHWEGTPFISEIACGKYAWISYLEIVNPGTKPLDMSQYLLTKSDVHTLPADALESLVPEVPTEEDFKNLYRSYVPGYKYHEDTTNWMANPGILSIDANANPIVDPGDVFVVSAIAEGQDLRAEPKYMAEADKMWIAGKRMNPNKDGIQVKQTVGLYTRSVEAIFLFRIDNDSVIEGKKPVGDPLDYTLVDVLSDGIVDDGWSIAGGPVDVRYRGRLRPKPYIYTGARSLMECIDRFGTHPDTSDWINDDWLYTDPRPYDQIDIPAFIGSHTMDAVTVYLSTVSSPVYLVSGGYAGVQTIQGDLTSTTVTTFLGNVDKADTAQVLTLLSGVDGSIKDAAAAVAGNDTLVVVSADGVNTSKYALVDIPLDTDAVLTLADDPSSFTIEITGSTGTISGAEYGGAMKDVVAGVVVPDLAVMNIIDGDGNLLPLQYMNYDSVKVDALVGDDIYFEVIAQDLVTIITYKLEPASLSSDAFVISSVYEVDEDADDIGGLADGTTVELLMWNVEVVKGATAKVLTKLGHERVDGIVSYDDVLKVVSEDGTNTTTYFMTFLFEVNPDANSAPLVTVAFSDTTFADPGTIMLSATVEDDGLPPPASLTYLWEVTSGNAADVVIENPDQLSTNVTFSAQGNYVITISANDGSLTTSMDVTVQISAVGVQQIAAPDMLVYPNPASDKLTLELVNMPNRSSIVSIYDLTGSAVYNQKLSTEKSEIDVTAFKAGLYIIKVVSGNRSFIQRVDIQ